ncbi:hypothetical protein [Candidatus Darwinibacter acetoxidans]
MAKDYTKELEKKGAERVRLTKQLQDMLLQVAKDIADSVPLGTEVEVDGVCYRAHRYNSNIGSFRTVVIVDPGSVEDFPLYRAIDNEPPGSEYYLHRDFKRVVRVATRDEHLHFANHLPEIIRAFEVKEDAIIEELRDAFERLRTSL